jgi:hypothetical protein
VRLVDRGMSSRLPAEVQGVQHAAGGLEFADISMGVVPAPTNASDPPHLAPTVDLEAIRWDRRPRRCR